MYRIRIELESEFSPYIYQALLPETKVRLTDRYTVSLRKDGEKLLIEIEASDLTALRASMNTYLRWLDMLIGIAKLWDGAGGI